MKLLFLGAVILVNATPVPDNCNGVTVKNSHVLHEREVLKTNVDKAFFFTVDRSTNTLYFSYSILGEENAFTAAKLDLSDKEFHNITSVPNGFAQSVDKTNNEIYIGAYDGVYKYDPKKDTAERYADVDADIWSLYYKDHLYYTEFPSQFLYMVINGASTRVKDLEDTKVDVFVIDNDDVMFYSNDTGLYGQKKGTKDAELYHDFDFYTARGMTIDKNGLVHFCMHDGIFVVNKDAKKFDKIVDMDVFGIAFDRNNNIIYSDANSIYRLKPNHRLTC